MSTTFGGAYFDPNRLREGAILTNAQLQYLPQDIKKNLESQLLNGTNHSRIVSYKNDNNDNNNNSGNGEGGSALEDMFNYGGMEGVPSLWDALSNSPYFQEWTKVASEYSPYRIDDAKLEEWVKAETKGTVAELNKKKQDALRLTKNHKPNTTTHIQTQHKTNSRSTTQNSKENHT